MPSPTSTTSPSTSKSRSTSSPKPPASEPLSGDGRTGLPGLLHVLQGLAELLDPFALFRGDELHAPGECFAPRPRDARVDQRVEDVTLRHAEPGHDRNGGGGEQSLG